VTILVTGSNGALGRILCQWLAEHSSEDLVSTSRLGGKDGVAQIACDVSDGRQVRDVIGRVRPRMIYHVAGCFTNDFERDYAVNALGAKHLADALLQTRNGARLVLFGSSAEYGEVAPEDNPIKESQDARPVSIYGLTKLIQTQLAGYFARTHGVDVVVARVFNLLIHGLSERLFVGKIERLIGRIAAGEPCRIEVGNLDSVRDYVSGAAALLQIDSIASTGAAGEAYNVASGHPTRMRDLLGTMLRDAGLDWSVVVTGMATTKPAGHHDVPVIYADMTKTNLLRGLVHG